MAPGCSATARATWSGDINTTFATLEAQVPLGLNTSMSGVPYWGTDIGGFFPAGLTPELYARWFAFGAFCPLFRSHGWVWRQHVPWAHGPEVEAICRRYAELRMQLLPYLYTLAWRAHRHGEPLMRPLAYHYPGDPNVWELGSEFLLGPGPAGGAGDAGRGHPLAGLPARRRVVRLLDARAPRAAGAGVSAPAPLATDPGLPAPGGDHPHRAGRGAHGRPAARPAHAARLSPAAGRRRPRRPSTRTTATRGLRLRGEYALTPIRCAAGTGTRAHRSRRGGPRLRRASRRSGASPARVWLEQAPAAVEAGAGASWRYEAPFVWVDLPAPPAGDAISVTVR